jgi:SAM-dependent methyltransferase
VSSIALWHDTECGGYAADLGVWERLASASAGPVLELGCGTGRVALHLARRGHEVWGVDTEPELLEVLASRASEEGLPVHCRLADIRRLELGRQFELALAPMQVLQVLGGPAARRPALERTASHLASGGRLAAAILERPAGSAEAIGTAAIPDVRESDGWIYSSLAVTARGEDGALEIRRLRESVSPEGARATEEHTERLEPLDKEALGEEASAAGLRLAETIEVPATDGYLGATVVVMERA